MLWTTDAAIALANGCQSFVADLFPSAKSDTPLTTAHSMPRSYAAAYRPKIKYQLKYEQLIFMQLGALT
jgi:hypothetical protein